MKLCKLMVKRRRDWGGGKKNGCEMVGGGHLFPSAKLTCSSQWLSKDISLFLHEISLSLEISVRKSLNLFNFREKTFRMVQVGFDFGASALECITLTPTSPRIC